MFKLITYQRKNMAGLLKACLPANVTSIPCTAPNLKECRRNTSDNQCEEKNQGPRRGHFFIWSLASKAKGSLMQLSGHSPEIECSGSYPSDIEDLRDPSLVTFHDTTTYPLASWSLTLTSKGTKYRVSVADQKEEKVIVAKDAAGKITDRERFLSWRHGSYTMLESKQHRDCFIGCDTKGKMKLVRLHDKSHPDPRALFLTHRVVHDQETIKP